MAKRTGLSKRVRFEVFKRDQFKCQYCGAAAPDVILQVDHIKAVSKGGEDDILNLVTACVACNAGKSDVPLSENTAVLRQRKQLEELAERREQLAMLVEWRDQMAAIETDKVAILVDRINARLDPFEQHLNQSGLESVRGWLRKFGLEASLYGIAQATTTESAEALINQMEQYAAAARKVEREPELRDYWAIRALLRARRFRYGPEWAPVDAMRKAHKAGATIEAIRAAASAADDYDEFVSLIWEGL